MAGRVADTYVMKVRFFPGLHSHSSMDRATRFYREDAGSNPAGSTGD